MNNMLVLKPEGKIPLGRPRCRWQDNIKMDVSQIYYEIVGGIQLAQDKNQ
jgi:hypothetical protein